MNEKEYSNDRVINDKLRLLASTIHFMTREEKIALGRSNTFGTKRPIYAYGGGLADYRLEKKNGEIIGFTQNRGFFTQPQYRYNELIVFPYSVLKKLINIDYLEKIANGKKFTINFGSFPQDDYQVSHAIDYEDVNTDTYKFGNNTFKTGELNGKAALVKLIKSKEQPIKYPAFIQDVIWDVYPAEGLVVSRGALIGRDIWKNATKALEAHDSKIWDGISYKEIKAHKPIFTTTARDTKYLENEFVKLIIDKKTEGYIGREKDKFDVDNLIFEIRKRAFKYDKIYLEAEKLIDEFNLKLKSLLNTDDENIRVYDQYKALCDELSENLTTLLKKVSDLEYQKRAGYIRNKFFESKYDTRENQLKNEWKSKYKTIR